MSRAGTIPAGTVDRKPRPARRVRLRRAGPLSIRDLGSRPGAPSHHVANLGGDW
ncbi:protein of unassigned function [Methylobacterium oryzae CBMB20]|uniref:Protein of unassigned function n=1 Tax=Methylobacterium oryzae CBMB20 TaxID=693986 RepID=A0A089QAL2_9HYPH|nr:protein of unassigned function [Methylobacterium oryzae CBMB20]